MCVIIVIPLCVSVREHGIRNLNEIIQKYVFHSLFLFRWIRLSLRKVDATHPHHRHYLPYRDYSSSSILPVKVGEIYEVDVELWPTNVVVSKGHKLVFEVSAEDTQGSGIFKHNHAEDRPLERLQGQNHIHWRKGVSGKYEGNYIMLPIIPPK